MPSFGIVFANFGDSHMVTSPAALSTRPPAVGQRKDCRADDEVERMEVSGEFIFCSFYHFSNP